MDLFSFQPQTLLPIPPLPATTKMSLDLGSLKKLGRPALQKLAKKHGIKANLKSDVIIELLIQRLVQESAPNHEPSSTVLPPKLKRTQANSRKSPATKAPSHPPFRKRTSSTREIADNLKAAINGEAGLHRGQSPIDEEAVAHALLPASRLRSQSISRQNAPREQSIPLPADPLDSTPEEGSREELSSDGGGRSAWSISNYEWNTPESSRANTPEPEADPSVLRTTVDHMAQLQAAGDKMRDQIRQCRQMAHTLKQRATTLREAARAERANLERIKAYTSHWSRTRPGGWSYEEVWEGVLRVHTETEMEITESDEEDDTEPVLYMGPPQQIPDEKDTQDHLDDEFNMDTLITAENFDRAVAAAMKWVSTERYRCTSPELDLSEFDRLLEETAENSINENAKIAKRLVQDTSISPVFADGVKRILIGREHVKLAAAQDESENTLKRTREEAGLDETPVEEQERRNPRPRIVWALSPARSPGPSPRHSPTPMYKRQHIVLDQLQLAESRRGRCHDKGKRKMTAEEVERMQQEEQDCNLAWQFAVGPQEVLAL